MTTAVIFDLFGTFLKIRDRQNPYRQLLRIGAQQGRAASPNDLSVIMALNGGLREAADVFGISLSTDQRTDLERKLDLELKSIIPFDDAMPAIELLRYNKIKIAVCSNLAQPYCSIVKNLLPGLDGYALSAELGLIKPDPEMYRSACAMLGVSPGELMGKSSAEVLMVGDSRRCDEQGPRCLGIRGHHLDRSGKGGFEDLVSFAQAAIGSCGS
ncbi:HAD family hydrolase [Pseudomonas promysalinigenes]|uniref:HAD family hydrolase n=1 Tax=Pseudomonas promysalinigenes TaxID=485898 RepID=UPI003FA0792C